VGAVTFAGGTALLVYAIATAPQHGTHLTLAGVAAAAALLAGFAVTERRAAQPLLPLRLLANGPLIRSGLGAAALNGSYWGLLLLTTFRLQDGQGWSPPWAAAALLPASVPPMLAAPFSRHLIRWAGPPRLILAGALAATTGYALALASSPTAPYLSRTLPALLLVGAGYVCAFAALHASVLAGVPASQARVTTGVYQAFVQIGGALVLAVLAALFVAAQRGAGQAAAGPWHAVAVSYRPATAIITAVSAIGVAAALAGQGPPMRRAERARSRRRADR
jgi:hypothetical protein